MSVYDTLKDVIRVVQKADNVELYCKLLDVGSQALELQDELCRLKEENSFLKEKNNLTSLIERHQEAFITRKDENGELRYCSHCWDAEGKLIQLHCREERGDFICPHCKVDGVFDIARNNAFFNTPDTTVSNFPFG